VQNVKSFYVLAVLTIAASICGMAMLLNLLVDPYGTYRIFKSADFVVAKPAAYRRVKLVKAYDLRRLKAEAIVLGTSRSHVALSLSHEGWSVPLQRRYNAAFDGATTKEMYAYLLHAYSIRPLRQVVLGLDFWQLGQGPAWTRPDFDPAVLFEPSASIHNAGVYLSDLSLLISIDSTKASVDLLMNHDLAGPKWLADDGQRLGDIFFRQVEPTYSAAPGAYFRAVDRQEIGFMLDDSPALPTSQRRYSPNISDPALTSFDYIAKIIHFCREHYIDLRIFLTPAHAHQLEIASQLGGWFNIERGKRQLVSLLSEDAASHPSAPAFPLWDFCDYSSVTTEPVPAVGTRAEMLYYWDSSHFKQSVGDWILDRLFGTRSKEHEAPPDFGVVLTPATVDSALESIRRRQMNYRGNQPQEVRFIKSAIEEIKQQRN